MLFAGVLALAALTGDGGAAEAGTTDDAGGGVVAMLVE